MKKSGAETIFHLSRKLYLKNIPLIPKILWKLNRIIFSCDIPYKCDIHPTVRILHDGLGVVIHESVKIGKGCVILQNVTIGVNSTKKRIYNDKEIIAPIIGNNVLIGAGSNVIGPVVVGDKCKVGAGSVVLNDIPPFSLAVGVPAKVVKKYDV